jgi:L-serine dehydratase
MISVFDLFKIGIGPSSSHTVGPMIAAKRFRDRIATLEAAPSRITAELFGSLAWTGRGHGTDDAISLGLLGEVPATIDPDAVADLVAGLQAARAVTVGPHRIRFDPATDLIFNFDEVMPLHTNAMRFRAFVSDGTIYDERVYYSVGGGFVVEAAEALALAQPVAPLAYDSADELLTLCNARGLTVAEVQMGNELAWREKPDIEASLDIIRDTMFACIERGLTQDGLLPGALKVRRRAKRLYESLKADQMRNSRPPTDTIEWVSLFAIAVNEENASGGRVVTAPTNGAAGIIPAVLRYLRDFCPGWSDERGRVFLLSAAAIGGLIKRRASISGAEVGCQGEVGSAASMAAAGLTAALGGDTEQIENAAEIAMEHHLGMTCDPIGGLVQIPCIERNAFGANKAIVAASLALRGDGQHHVSLDQVIETMRQTGADMHDKYKETSQGGLAVNVSAC